MWCVIGLCGGSPEGSVKRNCNLAIREVMGG